MDCSYEAKQSENYPLASAAIYYETREWSNNNFSLDYDSIGAGIGGGARFVVLGHEGVTSLAISPWGRFELGWQDADASRLTFNDGDFEENDISDYRYGFVLSFDADLELAPGLVVFAGAGVNFWFAGDTTQVRRDSDDDLVLSRSVEFRGDDLFFRGGLGFTF